MVTVEWGKEDQHKTNKPKMAYRCVKEWHNNKIFKDWKSQILS